MTRATCKCGKAGLLHSVEKPLQPRAPPLLSRGHGDTGITTTRPPGVPGKFRAQVEPSGQGPVAGGGECQRGLRTQLLNELTYIVVTTAMPIPVGRWRQED